MERYGLYDEPLPQPKPRHLKRFLWWLIVVVLCSSAYGLYKPLPSGLSVKGNIATIPLSSARFLSDTTYTNEHGERVSTQGIFDEIMNMIQNAHSYILLDMFLWNDFLGTSTSSPTRALSRELTEALIIKKKTSPNIAITVITDPINTVYGGMESKQFEQLRAHGIPVIETRLLSLRDSNPLYSGMYRVFFSWLDGAHRLISGGLPYTIRLLPNPFQSDGTKTTLRSYLTLLNFKANHRKVVIADRNTPSGIKMRTLITSANPHDASSAHTNVALVIDDSVWRGILESEQAVTTLSGTSTLPFTQTITDQSGPLQARILTEGAIKDELITMIGTAGLGDAIYGHVFYLSDRDVVKALISAHERGVRISLILDPNKDAFGHQKNGIPNRPVAAELAKKSDGDIQIRWCATNGEQCHSKLFIVQDESSVALMLGSANITRRNIGNFNLETNVWIQGSPNTPAIQNALDYFHTLWENKNKNTYTTPYETYADDRLWPYVLYRIMETLGTSSF